MTLDRERILSALADIGEVVRAGERLGISPAQAAERTYDAIDWARTRDGTGQELGYRIGKAAIDAARALT